MAIRATLPRPRAQEVELYGSITEIAAADWTPAQTFLQRGYLEVLEAHCGAQVRCDYALLRERGRALAGAMFHTVDLDPLHALPVLKQRPLVRRFLQSLRLRVIMCGNAFAGGPHGWWTADGVGAGQRRAWLIEAAARLAERARGPGVQVLRAFKDTDDAEFATGAAQYQPLVEDPVMALDLDPTWRSLDDYVAALRSPYRREYRRARERLGGVVRRPLDGDAIRAHAARIDALHAQVLARARLCPVRQDAATFAELADRLGPRFSIVGYFEADDLVAFNTRFRCGADLDSHYFGMDYAAGERLGLYRNILYDDIGDAIAAGCRRVLFGRAAQEIKSAMGARPLRLHSFIQHDSRVLTALLAASARWMKPPEWTSRHPFRT